MRVRGAERCGRDRKRESEGEIQKKRGKSDRETVSRCVRGHGEVSSKKEPEERETKATQKGKVVVKRYMKHKVHPLTSEHP